MVIIYLENGWSNPMISPKIISLASSSLDDCCLYPHYTARDSLLWILSSFGLEKCAMDNSHPLPTLIINQILQLSMFHVSVIIFFIVKSSSNLQQMLVVASYMIDYY